MITEAQQQIAREAAKTISDWEAKTYGKPDYSHPSQVKEQEVLYGIILSAIERATEFHSLRWGALQKAQHDMRDPERKMVCNILANGSTTAQSQRSEQTSVKELHANVEKYLEHESKISEQQEWTVERSEEDVSNPMARIMQGKAAVIIGWTMRPYSESFQKITDAHNAALTTVERQRVEALQGFAEKARLYERQLLSVLAAIEKVGNYLRWYARRDIPNDGSTPTLTDALDTVKSVDLSLLHEHVRKEQQPLVDALEKIERGVDGVTYKDIIDKFRTIAHDALAKVNTEEICCPICAHLTSYPADAQVVKCEHCFRSFQLEPTKKERNP